MVKTTCIKNREVKNDSKSDSWIGYFAAFDLRLRRDVATSKHTVQRREGLLHIPTARNNHPKNHARTRQLPVVHL